MQEPQPNLDDQVQRHSAAHQPHTHMHNGRPCTGHHGHQQQSQPNHSIYFKMLKESYNKNRVFFWNEVLDGGVVDELIKRYSMISFLKYFRNNYLQKFASTVLGFATQFLPNTLKPFFAGFFLPLLVFLYVNWKLLSLRIFPSLEETSLLITLVQYLYILTMVLFTLVGVIGPGSLASEKNKLMTQKLLSQKPYMNNPRVICAPCETVKAYRSQHCPNCKQCIPKFSKHSPVFNRCVGASNQLLYLLFTATLLGSELLTIYMFLVHSPEDMSLGTKIIICLINYYILWRALVETLKIFTLNVWYNLTEHEVRNWMFLPYLIAYGKRQFFNPLDIGLVNNVRQSLYSLFGCQQSEEQTQVIVGSIIQPEPNPAKYITNWAKAFYTNSAELRNHPQRREIAMKTKQMQKLIQMQTQIMNQVRSEVLNELKGKRPIHEINQIIMMQTQMRVQQEMQKAMRPRMQSSEAQIQAVQKKEQQESKGEEDERLIENKEKSESSVQLKLSEEDLGH